MVAQIVTPTNRHL